jgi:MFS family permease
MLLDKYGTRAVALPGALAVGLVIALFSTLNGSLIYWLALWVMLATAGQFIMHTIWAAALANHFTASRKLAFGILATGTGITTFLAPLLANVLIEHYGWRNAYLFLGLGWGGLVVLVSYFMLHDHRSRRGQAKAEAAAQPIGELTGLTVREGLRSGAFARISASVMICNLLNIGLVVHLIPILSGSGLARDTAVFISATFGLSMLAGNLGFGLIGDRIPAKLLGATVVASPAITCDDAADVRELAAAAGDRGDRLRPVLRTPGAGLHLSLDAPLRHAQLRHATRFHRQRSRRRDRDRTVHRRPRL